MTGLGQDLDEPSERLVCDIFIGHATAEVFKVFVLTGCGPDGDLSSLEARNYLVGLAGRADKVAPIAPDPARHIAPLMANLRVLREKGDGEFFERAIERRSLHCMSSA
jgi:hypothetical protein